MNSNTLVKGAEIPSTNSLDNFKFLGVTLSLNGTRNLATVSSNIVEMNLSSLSLPTQEMLDNPYIGKPYQCYINIPVTFTGLPNFGLIGVDISGQNMFIDYTGQYDVKTTYTNPSAPAIQHNWSYVSGDFVSYNESVYICKLPINTTDNLETDLQNSSFWLLYNPFYINEMKTISNYIIGDILLYNKNVYICLDYTTTSDDLSVDIVNTLVWKYLFISTTNVISSIGAIQTCFLSKNFKLYRYCVKSDSTWSKWQIDDYSIGSLKSSFENVTGNVQGYLKCDGSEFNSVSYPRLFEILGKSNTPNINTVGEPTENPIYYIFAGYPQD